MKTDRLLTLLSLIVMGVTCGLLSLDSNSNRVQEEKKPGATPGFTTNYASAYLGATLTDFSRSCKGASSVLNDDKEKYMICDCGAARKLITVQLIREIEVRIITLVNMEHFSSGVKNFTLLGSKKYPTNEWRVLGEFEASPWRGTQHFDVSPQEPVRFLRLLWATSHSDDSWCTLTSFKAFGVDVLETLTEEYVDVDEQLQRLSEKALPAPPWLPISGHSVHAGVGADVNGFAAELDLLKEKRRMREETEGERLSPQILSIVSEDVSGMNNLNNDRNYVVVNSSTYCDNTERVDNALLTCMPRDHHIYEARSWCKCPSKPHVTNKTTLPSKPFQAGTALQILTQMSKQLKSLQQVVDGYFGWQKNTMSRLEHTEASLGYVGVRLQDMLRFTIEYREKFLEMKKEMDMIESRLSLLLEATNRNGSNTILLIWVVLSNILAFFALLIACFSPCSILPGGGSRFPRRGLSR